MKRLSGHIIVVAMVATLMAACDSSVMYSENKRIDDDGWKASDKLIFNCEVEDTAGNYLCCLDIRNKIDYPYSNIYFFIKTIYPDGTVAVDTNVEFSLAEPDGRWRGRQNGRYVDGRYPLCAFHFPQRGLYQFVVSHAMRDTILVGMHDVGMTIQKLD
ncbi:MAG: gliding motility lipoprotein GldH [Bacteroidales bacterium]|nr:gliding motility lipoprotein GldH [Bacteroidales bacterium]